MLKNAPTLAIVAVDTDENEPPKNWGQKFHYFNPILTQRSRSFTAGAADRGAPARRVARGRLRAPAAPRGLRLQ